MRKKFILFLIIISIVFLCSACGVNEKIKNKEFYGEKEETEIKQNEKNGEPLVGIELWSFEIPANGDISEFLKTYANSEADYIDFKILWSSFEVGKGKYNWTFLDNTVRQITDAGFSVGLSLVLWTNGLEFKDELEFQKTSDGEIYAYDEDRKDFPSLNNENNIKIMLSTVQAFANHIAENYSENTVLWQVLTSPFGDAGYSAEKELDFGTDAMSDFRKYIEVRYETCEDFTDIYNFGISDFSELAEIPDETLVSKCYYDFRRFKQETLENFQRETGKIFKAANPNIPFQLFFGGIEDTKTAAFRGFFDPYNAEKAINADIYSTTLNNGESACFISDYLLETTGKDIGLAIDSKKVSEGEISEFINKIKNGITEKTKRICFIRSDNAEKDIKFLKELSSSLKTEKTPKQNKNDAILFINTADFVLRRPAKNIYSSLSEIYGSLSENGTLRIRIITDSMLRDGKFDENEMKKLYTESSGKYYYIEEKTAEVLADLKPEIFVSEDFTILNETGNIFPSEIGNVLAELFKEQT